VTASRVQTAVVQLRQPFVGMVPAPIASTEVVPALAMAAWASGVRATSRPGNPALGRMTPTTQSSPLVACEVSKRLNRCLGRRGELMASARLGGWVRCAAPGEDRRPPHPPTRGLLPRTGRLTTRGRAITTRRAINTIGAATRPGGPLIQGDLASTKVASALRRTAP
jgi:hypothetical protein